MPRDSAPDPNMWGRAVAIVLSRLRRERGLTQKAIGDRMGKDRNFIWELEHREYIPRWDTLADLAEALEMSPTEFVDHLVKENDRLTRRRRHPAR